MLPLFECNTGSSSASLEKIKLIAIINWVFCISDIFRVFIMSVNYDFVSSKVFLDWEGFDKYVARILSQTT